MEIQTSPQFDDLILNLIAIYIQQQNYKNTLECLNSLYHESERRDKYREVLKLVYQQK